MKPKHYTVAAVVLFLGIWSYCLNALIVPAVSSRGDLTAQVSQQVGQLSGDRYFRDLSFLASDELQGRASGSPGLEKAADYIASQFQLAGLQPAGKFSSYFQPFEVTAAVTLGPDALGIDGVSLEENKDFVAFSFSTNADFEAAVVFAGYGITAPDLKWDDYAGIDVKDKVVLVLRHEPQELNPASVFNGKDMTPHASFVNKAINARNHGAKGIVFVTDPNNHPNDPDTVGPASRNLDSVDTGIAAIHVRQAPIAALLGKMGKNLSAIQRELDSTMQPKSFELTGERFHVATNVVRVRKQVRNVLAAIRGSDPMLRDEWVVVGAHYDHLGLGNENSLAQSQMGQVHHGADDNASGTAGVLELARVVAGSRPLFKRSVLFMAFAGEEIGLLGSGYFVEHPTMPLGKIVAMINMDMIGRVKNDRLFIGGAGTSPGFKGWLEEASIAAGLKLDYTASGNSSSDHTSFNGKKIPVLFLFSGLHEDYHRPSDTADKIDRAGAIQVLSLAYRMTNRIADASSRPQYTEVVEPRPTGGGGAGYGPAFGSVPDFRDDLHGVLFADVRAGTPAAKAGLRAGDLLTEFDGMPIQNLYDFTYALQVKKVGDVVVVAVQRAGETIKVKVTLEARQ